MNRPLAHRSALGPRLAALAALIVVVSTQAGDAAAEQVTLQNDSFTDGSTVAVQAGFVRGELGAACFSAESDQYPVRLLAIRLIFGDNSGGGTTRPMQVKVFERGGGGEAPASTVYDQEWELESSTSAFSEIDVASENLTFDDSFCVGFEFKHDGVPALATDIDGVAAAGDNWIRATNPFPGCSGNWCQSRVFGVSGDWVIRAIVDASTGGGGGGGDTGIGPDAGGGGGDTGGGGGGGDAGTDVFIASISPSSGEADSDVSITLSGGGFESGFFYRIGPASLTDVQVTSPTQVQAVLPANSLDPGTYDAIVANGRGEVVATNPQAFQVRSGGASTIRIRTITPSSTQLGVSTNVIIDGSGFEDDATVSINGRALPSVDVEDEGEIRSFVPGDHVQHAGSYDVEVTNPDGSRALLTSGFTFLDAGSSSGCATTGRSSGAAGWLGILLVAAAARRRRR